MNTIGWRSALAQARDLLLQFLDFPLLLDEVLHYPVFREDDDVLIQNSLNLFVVALLAPANQVIHDEFVLLLDLLYGDSVLQVQGLKCAFGGVQLVGLVTQLYQVFLLLSPQLSARLHLLDGQFVLESVVVLPFLLDGVLQMLYLICLLLQF